MVYISIYYSYFSTTWCLYTLVLLNFILFRIPDQTYDAVIRQQHYSNYQISYETNHHFKGISSSNFVVIYECTVEMVEANKINNNGFDRIFVFLNESITFPLGATNLDVCMNNYIDILITLFFIDFYCIFINFFLLLTSFRRVLLLHVLYLFLKQTVINIST